MEFEPGKPMATVYLRTLFSGIKLNFWKIIPANFQYKTSAFMRGFYNNN